MKILIDKKLHFIAGAGVSCLVYAAVQDIKWALIAGIGVGSAKEIYDYINRGEHTPDLWDLVATGFGSAVACVVIYGLLRV